MPEMEISQELLDRMRMGPRLPRHRRFEAPDNGPLFFWTVEKADHKGHPFHERYISGVFKPVGKGSGSGSATEWEVDRELSSGHKLRRDAKARALRLYDEWVAAHGAGSRSAPSTPTGSMED